MFAVLMLQCLCCSAYVAELMLQCLCCTADFPLHVNALSVHFLIVFTRDHVPLIRL